MKLFFALSLIVATASAGVVPKATGRHALLPVFTQAEMEGRITNGQIAAPGQFPYQVGLHLHIGDKTGYCGGTIIGDRWILTAAHCSDIVDSVTVVLGATKILDKNEPNQQTIFVPKSNILVHENWNPETITNDIALLKTSLIQFNDFIQPARLPKPDSVGKYKNYVGDLTVASGWGKPSDSSNSVSEVLRWIEVPVISRSACSPYFFGMITDNMICISGKEGKSTCNGDSGGPLVYRENGVNTVIGATSFGIALGCEKGWPGVFTRVSAYRNWITEKTGIN